MQYRQRIINEHFKTDYFMSVSQIQQSSRERTREEILQMKAESAAVLSSIVGRIQGELLEPLIRLIIAIEREAGRLPEPTQEVKDSIKSEEGEDVSFMISFDGPLATAQKKFIAINGINEALGGVSGLSQMFGPDILYNVDGNWTARKILKANGFPIEGLNKIEDVQKMQKDAAENRAQAAQAQMDLEMAKIAGKATTAPEQGSMGAALAGGGM
jgi:hypothetical protein